MKKMTSIYLEEEQLEWFEMNPELSMSGVIRKLLDEYIKQRGKQK